MIGPEASALGLARRSSSSVGDQQHLLEQVVEVLLLLRGHLGELRRPAPVLGLQPFGGQLVLDSVGVRVRKVDLVDRDDDRHLGRARVRDRLLGLRHDAVVGGHDEHGQVGDVGAAGAHGRERLVARRVEEGDLAAVVVDLVGADVLRDPACLGGGDRRLADRVQERRLAVVDVAHDRDHRRPRTQRLLRVLEGLGLLVLLADVLDRHLALELGGDQLDLVVGERLRRRAHLAEAHEDLDQLAHRHAERLREVLDGDARLDDGGPGRRCGLLVGLRLARRAVARLARVRARAAGARVDHDAALASPGAVAAGANRSVRTFCHL